MFVTSQVNKAHWENDILHNYAFIINFLNIFLLDLRGFINKYFYIKCTLTKLLDCRHDELSSDTNWVRICERILLCVRIAVQERHAIYFHMCRYICISWELTWVKIVTAADACKFNENKWLTDSSTQRQTELCVGNIYSYSHKCLIK